MKTVTFRKIIAAVLLIVLITAAFVVFALADNPASEITHVLDASTDLAAMAQGAKADGDTEKAGTDSFFTVYYSAKTKIDASSKTFDDGYAGSQRINMGGSTAVGASTKNAIQFTTEGTATVKIWWVAGGDGREIDLYTPDGAVVKTTSVGAIKNSLYITTIDIDTAGTYLIGSSAGSNYYFKVEVTVTTGGAVVNPPRADFATVAAPSITGATDDGKGNLVVSANGLVGYGGADELVVTMLNSQGTEIATKRSIAEKDTHTLTFTPPASDTYTLKVSLVREGETAKAGEDYSAAFVYPLGAPNIVSATSKGEGTLEVIFTAVKEATSYEIMIDGVIKATTTDTSIIVSGLTVGNKVNVAVNAVRGTGKKPSSTVYITITENALQTWGYAAYGHSTNLSSNGYTGSVNEDGRVTVYVVDTAPSIVEDTYKVKVDKDYTGVIGAVVDGYNTFTTVQQALDFLKNSEPGAKKIIEIGAGKFTEKLEITIPNLTIKGAGRDLTVIEWNSLYGVPDASGYSQVTDSTASVAIRDTAVGCTIENITISNYWNSIDVFNTDLGPKYPEHRALALLVQADRFILRDSNLLGYLEHRL